MKFSHQNIWALCGVLVFGLGGCMPQQPALVVSGYKGGSAVEVEAPTELYEKPVQSAEAATVEGQRYSLTRQKFVPVDQAATETSRVASRDLSVVSPLVKEETLEAVEPAAGVPPQVGREEKQNQVTMLDEKSGEALAKEAAETSATLRWVEHKVEKGDTVYKISKMYEASVFDIMAANEIEKPQDLKAGTIVRVPVVQRSDARVEERRQELGVDARPEVLTTVSPRDDVSMTSGRVVSASLVNMNGSATEKMLEKFKTKAGLPERVEQLTAKALGEEKSVVEPDLKNALIEPEKSVDAAKGSSMIKELSDKTENKQKVRDSAANELRAELKRGQVDPVAAQASGRVWPVKGKIIRSFGEQGNGVAHSGISIAVPQGTPVLAMDGGQVLYADEGLKTYGKLVLVQHKNGMVSAYAHNGHLLVRKGERVKKGQIIATSGASGNVATPQLHFELRQHASAVDPVKVLPKL